MAYVLGFITADGSLEDAPYIRAKYLRITSGDRDLLEKLRVIMGSEHKIVTIEPKAFLSRGKRYISKTKYMLRIGSHKIYNDLVSLGITPRKSKIIELPQIPSELIPHYLRGYLDGDGCISVSKTRPRLSVIFTSGSQQFLDKASKLIASKLNIKAHNVYRNNRAFQLKYSTKESLKVLRYFYFDMDQGLCLQRKYNLYSDFIKANFPFNDYSN